LGSASGAIKAGEKNNVALKFVCLYFTQDKTIFPYLIAVEKILRKTGVSALV